VMAAILKVCRPVKNRSPSMKNLKNNSAKFHPEPIRNDGALGFFEDIAQEEGQQDE